MPTKRNATKWIDFISPTEKDLGWIQKKFHIHPVIIDELKGPSARSRVETYGDYLYLIYYFPVYDKKEETSHRVEIDMIITKRAVITAHYQPLEALNELGNIVGEGSLNLVYKILRTLLNFQDRQLSHIRKKMEAIGAELFKDREKEVLKKVSFLKRDISEYRIIVKHQEAILKSLAAFGSKFWGADSLAYLDDLLGDHLKIVNQVEDYREAIADFESTNNQLMSLKINAVMKTFTLLSFLTFPFVLLVALFSMNTKDNPLIDQPHAFWIIVGFIAVSMIAMTAYFKKRGWF